MKIPFLFAVFFYAISSWGTPTKPDPRIAELHKLHDYVQAKGKHITGQIPSPPPSQVVASQQDFTKLIKQSVSNLQALDKLNQVASPKADQLATIEKLITDEGRTLGNANNVLARTANLLQELRDKASLKSLLGGK